MVQKRRFERIKPTGRLSRSGKIIVDARSPAVECVIVDYSAGGACHASRCPKDLSSCMPAPEEMPGGLDQGSASRRVVLGSRAFTAMLM